MTIVKNGDFYSSYKKKRSEYSSATFKCAEETVEALLDADTSSEHPGMLLGKVQSGKTRTFISVMALAFDNGYDVAVILSKNSKALIEQTRKRLEDEFDEFIADEELQVYDIMSAPTSFTKFELDSKLVFIAKKQKHNLERLKELFSTGCPELAESKTLIIDDEADNASIGYSKKQDVIEANRIASQISDFREVIEDVSFLQVTATPYSLYLQPTEVDVENHSSFSPTRPKFTKLVPVPNTYVGGDTYFGENARSDVPTVESLIHVPVSEKELAILKKPDGRRFSLDDALTSSAIDGLRKAFVNFVVGGCIQRINRIAEGVPSKKLRYSFLMHSEAAKDSHAWQDQVVDKLKEQLTAEGSADSDLFGKLIKASYEDLSRSIKLADHKLPSLKDTRKAVREALAGDFLTISKVNSDEQIIALLDNSGQLRLRSPLNIFIGGQVLDRGVTLSNLIGFYYGRRPNKFQQDTVLQHSRMYGYRQQDLPVTRFYTTPYIRSAMFEMEEFDSSLRAAIESGGDQSVQFIRQAENGGIVPCSPNKILVATTQALRPYRRLLPIGFQTDYKTRIGKVVQEIDEIVEKTCGFEREKPELVELDLAIDLLERIEPTLVFLDEDDVLPFDWNAARAALIHLSNQHSNTKERRKVLLWAAKDRNSSRLASGSSHARFIETPDSQKTEGKLAKSHAIEHPILFLLRQNGKKERGWRDTPFYWPVVRAQKNTPTTIYTVEAID